MLASGTGRPNTHSLREIYFLFFERKISGTYIVLHNEPSHAKKDGVRAEESGDLFVFRYVVM
jgi:hypothetical protein